MANKAIKIQVLGKGLIPRGLGIAPRTEPFFVDKITAGLIVNSPNLKTNYLDPNDGSLKPLDRSNLDSIWDKFADHDYSNIKKVETPAPVSAPITPAPKFETAPTVTPTTPPVVETKPEVKDDVKQEVKPNTNQNNNQNNNNNNKHNNNKNNNQNQNNNKPEEKKENNDSFKPMTTDDKKDENK